jgi:hypothetical protein
MLFSADSCQHPRQRRQHGQLVLCTHVADSAAGVMVPVQWKLSVRRAVPRGSRHWVSSQGADNVFPASAFYGQQ